MSAIVESVASGQDALPVCLWQENPYRLVSLWQMLSFHAGHFIAILDNIARLREQLTSHPESALYRETLNILSDAMRNIEILGVAAEAMGLSSSAVQARRVLYLWKTNPSGKDVAESIEILEGRIRDDLHERIFYCVLEDKASFFKRELPRDINGPVPGNLRIKTAAEYFGEAVVQRFGAIESDLSEVCRCYVYECAPACVFHLMRATEIAIPKIAKLCSIQDPKASWGAVLDQAERLTQKTKFSDLPANLQPNVEFLRTIVADMRSMQKAWRNKVTHVEDKLVVISGEFPPGVAFEILTAVGAFLRHLAEGLPDWC